MHGKRVGLLTLGLGIASGTLLINTFVIPLPEWIAIGLALLAATLIVLFVVKSR